MVAGRKARVAEAVLNKGERIRQRIKTAFSKVLEEKSFASVTIADICRTSDITVGGFYFHFSSPEELLTEVMAEYSAELIADFDRALADGHGEKLAAGVCGAFVRAYSGQTGLARTFQQLIRMRSDYAVRWRVASERRVARLGEILQSERTDLNPGKARFLAYALITLIMSRLDLVYVYRDRDEKSDKPAGAALVRELSLLWLRMVDGRGK